MSGWSTHTGTAVVLPLENVDTDQIIPARFMSTPRSEGYGRFLLHDLAHDAEGAKLPGFALNRHPDASVLVTRRNFGGGSSREAAVYALVDSGIRAVIAPSFGDIFAANAVNNGLLPARVSAEAAEEMITSLGDATAPVRISLTELTITLGDRTLAFDLADTWREKLINGWDDIDLTLQERDANAAFRDAYRAATPWAWPAT
ncbi:3-isopropylmalate dehydratase small subunit [Oceanibium sediminis]|uniref:3-isopropylmalate dehydratase small subunit n=1 Tax=Oceanibium sediminis TaxID=2026339 RepID=UPI000DD308ED|nr:3-isopropylmalate dehydratase small subunit [Oceanibium sediminis]